AVLDHDPRRVLGDQRDLGPGTLLSRPPRVVHRHPPLLRSELHPATGQSLMTTLLKLISLAGLGLTLVPSFLVFARVISWESAAGFGGVEVTSIYGVRGYEHAFVPYLSDRWLDLLLHAAAEARRLGMGLDMPPGSGWRLGGPSVPREDASASLHIEADTVRGVYVADARPLSDKVKRPAPGGEGYAIDPFSRLAVRHYLNAYGGRLKAIPSGTIRAFFHDSFEYTGTGSAELFEMFRRRRGYDLRRYLRFLLGEGDPDVVARVKSDYRETMDEMLLDHLLRPLTAWAHERGSRSRNQAHGSPGNLLDLYAASDIPET